MKKDVISLAKSDFKAMEDRSQAIDNVNRKIQILRKRQIYKTLTTATKSRVFILEKIKSWIEKLDTKIFDPQTLADMPIDRAMVLLSKVLTFTTKTMGQMDELDRICQEYLAAAPVAQAVSSNPLMASNEEKEKVKSEILKAFVDGIKQSAANAIVIQKENETKNLLEMQKLDEEKQAIEATSNKQKEPVEQKKPDTLDELEDLTPVELPEYLTDDKLNK